MHRGLCHSTTLRMPSDLSLKSCKYRATAMPVAAPYLKPSNRQHQNTLGDYQLKQIKETVAQARSGFGVPIYLSY